MKFALILAVFSVLGMDAFAQDRRYQEVQLNNGAVTIATDAISYFYCAFHLAKIRAIRVSDQVVLLDADVVSFGNNEACREAVTRMNSNQRR